MIHGAWLQPVMRSKPQFLRFLHLCRLPSALFSSSPLYHPGNLSGLPGLKPHLTHIRCSINYRLASTPHQLYKFSYELFHSKNTQKMTGELFKFTSPFFFPPDLALVFSALGRLDAGSALGFIWAGSDTSWWPAVSERWDGSPRLQV